MVLKTDTMTYQLDDQTKTKQLEGKPVNVNGTLDKSTSMIRVTDIRPLPRHDPTFLQKGPLCIFRMGP